MKLQSLFENNQVSSLGQFSFSVEPQTDRPVTITNFITGEEQISATFTPKQGDQLHFNYDIERRGPSEDIITYSLKYYNNNSGREKLIEDADFKTNSEEDVGILKSDIQLKLKSLGAVLDSSELSKVNKKYNDLMQAIQKS